jgi:hypothetical protein
MELENGASHTVSAYLNTKAWLDQAGSRAISDIGTATGTDSVTATGDSNLKWQLQSTMMTRRVAQHDQSSETRSHLAFATLLTSFLAVLICLWSLVATMQTVISAARVDTADSLSPYLRATGVSNYRYA